MELKQIRKYFYEDMTYNKKNFVVSITDKEDSIYYKGIKILNIKDNKLVQIFLKWMKNSLNYIVKNYLKNI